MATPKKTPAGRWWVQIEIAGQRESSTFDTKRALTYYNPKMADLAKRMQG